MKVLIIAAGLAALAAPASALERTDNYARNTGSVSPGLQYTVTGRDGATVTVIEGQPRWTSQRRLDDRLVPGGDDVRAIVNILDR
jgi:hypothetical protein